MQYPDTETVAYEFDASGNVTEITDPNGSVIEDTYDDDGRRTARGVTRGTGVLGTTSETFTYDGLGRMTQASDNDYKVEFTYGVIGLSSQVYEEKQSYVGGTA
jgi:YD repeat-containing protein